MRSHPLNRSSLGTLSRRDCLRLASAGVVGCSLSGWMDVLAHAAAQDPQRRKSCILLWMNGGPSQIDTFDLKPGHLNGGPYKEIQTSVPGIRISEHLPRIARFMDRMAIIRSMSSKEGDHGRATFLMRTGNFPQGPIQYPSLGALISKELGDDQAELPNSVNIAPYRAFSPNAYGSGFLGPRYDSLVVGDALNEFNNPKAQNSYEQTLKVRDMALPSGISMEQANARVALLQGLEKDFNAQHPGTVTQSHQNAYDRAVRLMRSAASKAFDLDEESPKLRDLYGRNLFGQGCLLARRLVERGVPFVEVTLATVPGLQDFGWDTHGNNFDSVKRLSAVLDPAWATLMEDLESRGLLDSTLIVWMGEFGRTPKINGGKGRDHYPNAFSTVLAGGGIKGGQVIGKTSKDGTTIEDKKVSVIDFLATICRALGIDPTKQNMSNVGRPIRIVDKSASPIEELIASKDESTSEE